MADTTIDFPFEYYTEHDIAYVGMTVTMNNREYRTDVPGEVDPEWFLESILAGAEPTTAQVNVGQFSEVFKKYAEEKTPLLYLAFSSGLSGTYSSAVQARELILEEYPEAQITIIDTLMAANGEGLIIDRAMQLRDAGKTLEEVVAEITPILPKVRAWFTVDDLHHLQRGGRISKAAAVFGSLANIKPIMDVDPEGKLRPVAKVRGRKKSLRQLADNIINDLPNPEDQTVYVNYSGDKEAAESVLKMVLDAVPTVKASHINPLGPTIVTHTGSGCVAIFAIGAENRE
jgi:DegV family protein with EDD domain